MNLRQLVERPDRPFASQPQVARYFPAASMEDARRRLGRSIERGDGPGVVIGGAGIGKSLLLQVLAAQFREKFDVVLLACAQLCTRRALLQAIHFELGLDYRRRDEGELRLSLLDTLLSSDESTEGLLLLVDESQALANHLLEELRLLTNLSRGGAPRIRLVMAGLPALEEKFATPELQSFSQRLASRCYLAPMTRAETEQYVRAQLAASQADADRLVAAGSYDAIFAESDGVPRLVNQICDRALMLADARQLESIDAKLVRAAWADLQQLPTTAEPSPIAVKSDATHNPASSNVVEFGSLHIAPPSAPIEATLPAPIVAPPPKAKIELPPVAGSAKPLRAKPTDAPRPVSAAPAPPAPPSPAPANRPRVPSATAPDAVDPFDDSFEEEELVLESFATLASIFGQRTPRVENNREPAISRLVQNALDASSDAAAEIDARCEPESDEAAPDERSSKPTIRLKVVADSSSRHEEPRSNPPRETRRERRETPALVSATAELADRDEPSILVIEDELDQPALAQLGVRRENYRQLFTRLRHGT
jgi:type II secretory pathway predicted ATPase ExeA